MIRPRAAAAREVPQLAELHAQAFDEPWGVAEIGALLDAPGGFALLEDTAGFILCRAVAGEAEILTLAVAPNARRMGLGRALVEAAARKAARAGAGSLFLEVAQDNAAAIGLYEATGFAIVGRRAAYYRRGAGAVDAVVMRRALNRDG
jgi:ribosomal-protein-alanine N-acetyltransferase